MTKPAWSRLWLLLLQCERLRFGEPGCLANSALSQQLTAKQQPYIEKEAKNIMASEGI